MALSSPPHRTPDSALENAELLRFATAGSVDDGKSTLIGRLLYDTKQVFADQLEHVEEVSSRRGDGYVNLALLTDGLRAEREQGITIDVAYRYFATPQRRFIIADTPGHQQYTRNMVTGASTADLSVVLIDARNGVVDQSRRHAFISGLLGIPHLVVAVNKMDLVGWAEDAFDAVVRDFSEWAAQIDGHFADVTFIPISALHGDNVVDRSENTPWYGGESLLAHLEQVRIASDPNLDDARLPVQWVNRPIRAGWEDYRGYSGQVASGIFRPGDAVTIQPSGRTTTITSVDSYDGELTEAGPGRSVTLRLADQVDISRGDVICGAGAEPRVTRELEADVCWMADAPLRPRGRYVVKHGSRAVKAVIDRLEWRMDMSSLGQETDAPELALNDIGRVHLRTASPLVLDPYTSNRAMGAFIVIDEATNETVGAGMVA